MALGLVSAVVLWLAAVPAGVALAGARESLATLFDARSLSLLSLAANVALLALLVIATRGPERRS